ncbi:MAG TPA: hypothetical protein DCO86_02520, partial [Spirochaetaceae bacterium]|nr:hypothetical protein [Spirochaetaceae bacterium]
MIRTELETFTDEYGNARGDIIQEDSLIKEFNEKIENTNFHIYGLYGGWGTGKTTFVKLWERRVDGNKNSVIHIDAFEKDYIQDPFGILFSAFKKFMKDNGISQSDAKGLIDCAKKVAFASLKGMGTVLINRFIGEENLKVFADSFLDNFDYNIKDNEVDICEELKDSLKKILEKTGGKKLYIVIDELDRCRPDFALEMLERIKHIFAIDGVKFVLVYNPILFKGIVMKKYGCLSEESESYFSKFIEYEIPFSVNQKLREYIDYEVGVLSNQGCLLDSNVVGYIRGFSSSIAKVLSYYGVFSLRQISKFISSVKILEDYGDTINVKFSLAICLLKMINKEECDGIIDYLRKNNN